MEDRIKNLEIEITYLKRELDSLRMCILNQKPNVTTNNMVYNVNQIPDYPYEEDDQNFSNGVNFN
ncbi:MAG: hypothetical protein M0R03_12455 [Novosphingobium sp.]|nr:hypothetical protein [Novosphingobium sp.]